MPVELQPEIYRLIIKALVSQGKVLSETSADRGKCAQAASLPSTSIRREYQAYLARMMRVSKIFYEICKTELYRDCLVGDIDTFVQDIESNLQKAELLNQTKTLRIYQEDQLLLKEPTYHQIISNDNEWSTLGARLTTKDDLAALRLATENVEFAGRYLSYPAFRSLRARSTVFPGLERVTMTREAESYPWGDKRKEFDLFSRSLLPRTLPYFFASLPSVKHYCQWSPTGPLALPNNTLKVDHPPEIVTTHFPGMFDEFGPLWLPPVILGSNNRYMFGGGVHLSTIPRSGNASVNDTDASIFAPLEALFSGLSIIQCNPDQHEILEFASESLENTVVEIYDFVQHTIIHENPDDPLDVEFRPTDLSLMQAVLDEKIGRWKGKVFLKSQKECPPCSACGFEGFWKYK